MRRTLERGAAVAAGLLLLLLVLEIAIRASGGMNPGADVERDDNAIRVMCIGESTTAMGGEHAWPAQLEDLLNTGGARFQVINRGLGGADSSVLMARLDRDLERYQPALVVAMMGANDPVGTAGSHGQQPARRALPDHGESLADRGGPGRWFATWRLVELSLFELGRDAPPSPPTPQPPRTLRGDHEAMLELLGSGREHWPPELTQAWEAAEQGDPAQARALLERSAGGHDDAGSYQRELAILHESQGRLDEAEQAWLEQVTPLGYSGFARARLLAGMDRCEEAAELARDAVGQDPVFGPIMVHTGLCWARRGDTERAEADFRNATTRRQAVTHLLSPVHQAPEQLHLFHQAAHDMYEQAEANEAWPPLAEPLMRNPQDPGNDLAWIGLLELEGDPERMASELQQLTIRTGSAVVLARIARYHQERGEHEQALQALARSSQLRAQDDRSATRRAYDQLETTLQDRGIGLAVAQYANRPLAPLQDLRPWHPSVVLVDNHEVFQRALAEHGFDALFVDQCYGDLGHATPRGNRILAENIAASIAPLLAEASP